MLDEFIHASTGIAIIFYYILRSKLIVIAEKYGISKTAKDLLFNQYFSLKNLKIVNKTNYFLALMLMLFFVFRFSLKNILGQPVLSIDISAFELISRTVFAPFFEEYAFRGVLLGLLLLALNKTKLKHKIGIANIVQAFLFSIWHLDFRILAIIIRFISGYLNGKLALDNKMNLLPSTIAHSIYNFIELL